MEFIDLKTQYQRYKADIDARIHDVLDHGHYIMGPEISEREKKTDDAMFEVIRLKTAAYMQRHIGDEFSGVVTSILPFGIFVEIFDPPFDGMVTLADMGKARIEEDRAVRLKKRTVSIGDIIRVRVARVDSVKGHVDFSLLPREPRHPDPKETFP